MIKGFSKLRIDLRLLTNFFFGSRGIQKAANKYANYSFPVEKHTHSERLYDDICSRLYDLIDAGIQHLRATSFSSMGQTLTAAVLLNGREELTPDVLTELAQLLTSVTNVESAGVPSDLKELGRAISHSDFGDQFAKESPEVA